MQAGPFDVFLSYARDDRERAAAIASALESQGLTVWWDRKIVVGQLFDRAIEEQLVSAPAVLVLWSARSVDSEWVRNEASTASERDALVSALLDPVRPPLEFRRRQFADLTGWDGDVTATEFQKLHQGILSKLSSRAEAPRFASPASASTPPPPRDPAGRVNGRATFVWTNRYAIVAAVAALAIALWAWRTLQPSQPTPGMATVELATGRVTDVSGPTGNGAGSGRTPDDPAPIRFNTVNHLRLEANQVVFLQLPSPALQLDIVMDLRLLVKENGNLIAKLSVLDQNGGVLRDEVIGFNEIDRERRTTGTFVGETTSRMGLRLANGPRPAECWLTVRLPGAKALVPFFGDVVPQTLLEGQAYSGNLGAFEYAYYQAALRRGAYDVVLDLSRPDKGRGNITGALQVLDPAGGLLSRLLSFNEIDASYRRVAPLVVTDDRVIFRIQSNLAAADYTLRVQPSPTEAGPPGRK